jgi:hypothetical protein
MSRRKPRRVTQSDYIALGKALHRDIENDIRSRKPVGSVDDNQADVLEHLNKASRPFNVTAAIIGYENGELDEDETIELFQHLVDTGLAWQLQGHYGRTAAVFIKAGAVTVKGIKSEKVRR